MSGIQDRSSVHFFGAPSDGGDGGVPGVFVTGAEFAASTNTGALGRKSLYACTDTGAPRTLTISSADIAAGSPTEPWFFTVSDKSGGANTNNITVATEGAETIDGGPLVIIFVNFGSLALYSDGSNLFSR